MLIGINVAPCTAARKVTGVGVDPGLAEGLMTGIRDELCTVPDAGAVLRVVVTGQVTYINLEP